MIRPMRPDDVPRVVEIHLASFPGFFLSVLGARFLALLYTCILSDTRGIALVAADDGSRLVGFVAGVTRQEGFYRSLLRRHLVAFAFASVGALVRRPRLLGRLLRALRRPAEAAASSAEACLMSVAVAPTTEGRGVGRALVDAFCGALAARGVDAVCLTTDSHDNDRTNRFYTASGFTRARSFVTADGRAMNEYVKHLNTPDHA